MVKTTLQHALYIAHDFPPAVAKAIAHGLPAEHRALTRQAGGQETVGYVKEKTTKTVSTV